jgi:hypothetical protein
VCGVGIGLKGGCERMDSHRCRRWGEECVYLMSVRTQVCVWARPARKHQRNADAAL